MQAVEDSHDRIVDDVEDGHDHAGHGGAHEVALGEGAGHAGLGVQGLEHGGDEVPAGEEGVRCSGHAP